MDGTLVTLNMHICVNVLVPAASDHRLPFLDVCVGEKIDYDGNFFTFYKSGNRSYKWAVDELVL